MRAPPNVVVLRWQVSHGAVVAMWLAGLPVAVVPLWQEAQLLVMPLWSMRAPENVNVLLWQVSHGAVVTMWFAGLARAWIRCGSRRKARWPGGGRSAPEPRSRSYGTRRN